MSSKIDWAHQYEAQKPPLVNNEGVILPHRRFDPYLIQARSNELLAKVEARGLRHALEEVLKEKCERELKAEAEIKNLKNELLDVVEEKSTILAETMGLIDEIVAKSEECKDLKEENKKLRQKLEQQQQAQEIAPHLLQSGEVTWETEDYEIAIDVIKLECHRKIKHIEAEKNRAQLMMVKYRADAESAHEAASKALIELQKLKNQLNQCSCKLGSPSNSMRAKNSHDQNSCSNSSLNEGSLRSNSNESEESSRSNSNYSKETSHSNSDQSEEISRSNSNQSEDNSRSSSGRGHANLISLIGESDNREKNHQDTEPRSRGIDKLPQSTRSLYLSNYGSDRLHLLRRMRTARQESGVRVQDEKITRNMALYGEGSLFAAFGFPTQEMMNTPRNKVQHVSRSISQLKATRSEIAMSSRTPKKPNNVITKNPAEVPVRQDSRDNGSSEEICPDELHADGERSDTSSGLFTLIVDDHVGMDDISSCMTDSACTLQQNYLFLNS